MKKAAVLFCCFAFVLAAFAQHFYARIKSTDWILGLETGVEFNFIDAHNRSYTTNIYERYYDRPIRGGNLTFSVENALRETKFSFKPELDRTKPGDSIRLLATYKHKKKIYSWDTILVVPEFSKFTPVYKRKDTITPGEGIAQSATALFTDGTKLSWTETPNLSKYFHFTCSYPGITLTSIHSSIPNLKYMNDFTWSLVRNVDKRVVFADTLTLNYACEFKYYGTGFHGHDGWNGSSGDDGKEGEHAGHGQSGGDGTSGGHGNNIEVYINRLNDSTTVSKVKIIDDQKITLCYVDLSRGGKLFFNLEGGRGGNGGNGGDGGKGGKPNEATGTGGGNGGDGGNGGYGATGGNGGSAVIYMDTFSIKYKDRLTINNGGGRGGEGGYRGSYGSGRGEGKDGSSGSSGEDAKDGKRGKVEIIRWEE